MKWLSAKRARRKKKREEEFKRAYGGPERAGWIRSLPCCVCERRPSDNAHVETGGMGRKADADKIVPLCNYHHVELHMRGVRTFEQKYGKDLRFIAQGVAKMWNEMQTEDLTA